jgi:hypothetical protein
MADSVNTHQNRSSKNPKGQSISIWKIFSYADFVDVSMMVLGTLGSIADGSISTAGVSVMMSGLMNTLGSDSLALKNGDFVHRMNKVKYSMIFNEL